MSSASCVLIEADWLCGSQCPAASTYYKNGSVCSDEKVECFTERRQRPGHSSWRFPETRRITRVDSDEACESRGGDYEEKTYRGKQKTSVDGEREDNSCRSWRGVSQAGGAVRFSLCEISLCSCLVLSGGGRAHDKLPTTVVKKKKKQGECPWALLTQCLFRECKEVYPSICDGWPHIKATVWRKCKAVMAKRQKVNSFPNTLSK